MLTRVGGNVRGWQRGVYSFEHVERIVDTKNNLVRITDLIVLWIELPYLSKVKAILQTRNNVKKLALRTRFPTRVSIEL